MRRHGEAGFTLVELLLAIAILALIMNVLGGGLRLGARAWQAGEARLEDGAEARLARAFIRHQLAEMQPIPRSASRDARRLIEFDGKRDSIAFVGLMPPHLGLGGLYAISFARVDDTLLLRHRRFDFDAEEEAPQDGEQERVLADGVDRIEFAYFGVHGGAMAADWHTRWSNAESLPQLVRLRVALRGKDPEHWPDLVVAPAIMGDVSCVFDTRSKGCRGG
jgi:general secretion pathway protein J